MISRNFIRRVRTAASLALVAGTQPALAAEQASEADAVYKNGFVYTVDAVRTR